MKKPALVRAFSEALTLVRSTYLLTRPFSSATPSTFSVKKVTKTNFESALEDLRRHVRDADFVSFDLEMTGVTSAPWRDSFEFDRFDVRYLKVKDSAEKFAVVQFGVCPFRWDASKESFVAHPHNFYIFPRKELTVDGPAYEFLCQTSSIDFLAKHQFDFNACIHEGISYLSRAQEAESLRCLNLAHGGEISNSGSHLEDFKDIPLVRTADILFTERMKNRFSEWRDGLLCSTTRQSQLEGQIKDSKQQLQTVFFKMRPALTLNGFTSHQLRLIQLVIRKHFKDLAYVRVYGDDSSEQKLVVYTDSEDDKDLLLKHLKDEFFEQKERKVKNALGFRQVIDLLSSEKKLLVGHNCFLDIAHIYNKFFGPLPATVEEFVSSVHENFPYIIDTKHLLNVESVIQHLMKKKSTSLSSAFSLLCPQIAFASRSSALASHPFVKVEVQVDEMRSSNWNSGAKHEAGYDAFMTGCVFAQVCRHLDINFQVLSLPTELVNSEKLQKHINLLYLSWNNGDVINLSSRDISSQSFVSHNHIRRYPKIVFSNIVLIWGFPSKLKPGELRECVTKVFGPGSVTSIYYLDKTAAFIQFNKEEFVFDFLVLKETLERNNDPISILHPLSKLLEGGKTGAATYEVYKEICRSSISQVLFADQAQEVGVSLKSEVVESREEVGNQEFHSLGRGTGTQKSNSKISSKLYGPYHHLSSDKVMDALYVAESNIEEKRAITANL
ncbi:PREDICTED: poly(A)-specific ribonuclease PARN isoform X2 [Nelumbo nucifera]|uniref:Poly(A)-specific ribonuclease PARN isoform X2 n=1 Tax=Nelumbo nucifera TaxID=4432 RepID=A0A1U8AYP0_NELNU|nr:PREDICTED: poly(A)-specific ribonuclease PARN isoform X2 [Nelumbo nucifera]